MSLTETPASNQTAAKTSASADEQRFARRKPCHVVAEIRTSPKATAMPCIVRDMSSTGALIDVGQGRSETFAAAPKLPNEFTLVMRRDFTEVDCRVMWRKGMLMGVRYTSPVRILPRPARGPLPQKSAVDKMLDSSPVVQNTRKFVKAVRL
jgi:hypothetical protein